MKRMYLVLAALVGLSACAVNPVSGHRELALITESQEIEMGRQTAAAAEAQLGLVDDRALQDYVQRIGSGLAQASERPALPWTFRVAGRPDPQRICRPRRLHLRDPRPAGDDAQ
jgi:predicted Zn-dependent protease